MLCVYSKLRINTHFNELELEASNNQSHHTINNTLSIPIITAVSGIIRECLQQHIALNVARNR